MQVAMMVAFLRAVHEKKERPKALDIYPICHNIQTTDTEVPRMCSRRGVEALKETKHHAHCDASASCRVLYGSYGDRRKFKTENSSSFRFSPVHVHRTEYKSEQYV